MPKSEKGFRWEREFSVLLSKWWTEGKRDDVFWRTGGSGGRATGRRKKGKDTYGQASDTFACDPIGIPFTDTFACELKKGYSKSSPFDAMDKLDRYKPQVFQQWIAQSEKARANSGSRWWLIVFCRDRRQPMMAFPAKVLKTLPGGKVLSNKRTMLMRIEEGLVALCRLDEFMACITPRSIKTLHSTGF
jgi:hypothetical protein